MLRFRLAAALALAVALSAASPRAQTPKLPRTPDGHPDLQGIWDFRSGLGDARGRWEGDTLVVDSTNFSDRASFHGSGANLHLVERFTRIDAATLEYRFTVEDPTTWTRPWTVAFPMIRSDGPIYEYACHEGNYGLRDILSGARYEEKIATEPAETKKKQ